MLDRFINRPVVGLLAIFMLQGCAQGPQTTGTYMEPKLDAKESARLSGSKGTWIEAVDNQHVASSDIRGQFSPGNSVILTSGRHQITVSITGSGLWSRHAPMSGTYDFVAGHEYEVGANDNYDEVGLRDKTENRVIDFLNP